MSFRPDRRLLQIAADEYAWLNARHPGPLLNYVKDKAGHRKCRLFACASSRWLADYMERPECLADVTVAERFADGLADVDELARAHTSAEVLSRRVAAEVTTNRLAWGVAIAAVSATKPDAIDAAFGVVVNLPAFMSSCSARGNEGVLQQFWNKARSVVEHGKWFVDVLRNNLWQEKHQTELLRDIFDNPFRSVTIDSALLTWRDATIPKLAQAAYDERELPSGHLDGKRLAILADALEEAGCTNDDVLSHLRGAGPHVRGCWVVDLLLRRE